MQAELIVDARNAVGESPVWVPEENALYWVDIPAGGLQRWSAATGHVHAWTAPEMLACVSRHRDGARTTTAASTANCWLTSITPAPTCA